MVHCINEQNSAYIYLEAKLSETKKLWEIVAVIM